MATVKILFKLLVINVFVLCSLQNTNAQVQAEFTSDVQNGCGPLIVNFTSQSTGNIIDYLWKFGNNNSSDTVAPLATYISPGNYTVTLIVYGAGGEVDSIVKKDFITVYAKPKANLTASKTSSCLGSPIQFTDLSSQGTAQINAWQWDFGDGAFSSQQNPAHEYQGLGTYTVSLKVTDANGCTDFFFIDNYIQIVNPPKANFTGTSLAGCAPPHTAFFSDASQGIAPFTYTWDFGDGFNSTQENPNHTYQSIGNFDVQLIIKDNSGCSDTLVKNSYVSVDEPVAEMTLNKNYGCSFPATYFQFGNISTGPSSDVRWEFGDGSIATVQNPTHTYNAAGIYTVRLISGNMICRDTVTETIYVQQLSANFDMDRKLSCDLPLDVNFTDQSSNAVSWDWTFGDGSVSTLQNPSHSYTYEDTFTVQLTISDSLGCISTYRDTAIADIPEFTANYLVPSFNFCIPVDVLFYPELSSTDPPKSIVWNFGNGDTSHLPAPQYTYTDTGEFTVIAVLETELGCIHRDTFLLEIGDKPIVTDAYVIEDTVCRKDGANLNIISNFGEQYIGYMPGIDTVFIIDSTVSTSGGEYDLYTPIYISGIFHNCIGDQFIFDDSLYLKGPFCDKIDTSIQCQDPYTVTFGHVSHSYQLTHWSFGDGTFSNDEFPVHTYAARGVYTVDLILTDTITGCTMDKSLDITITEPIARPVFNDTVACRPMSLISRGANSQDADAYTWESSFPSLNYTGEGPDTTSLAAGNYTISLIVTDIIGCKDTSTHNLKVYGHENQITSSANSGCAPITIDFEASVTADTTIQSYLWNINGFNFSDTAVSYEFTQAGNYTVGLVTIDDHGCSAASVFSFSISDPTANFVPSRQTVCKGDDIIFVNSSSPAIGLTYDWDFGDGTTSTQRVPTKQYAYNDTFTVGLLVTDIHGCKDSIEYQDIIKVSSPTAAFGVSDTFAPCPPLFVNFADSSAGGVTSWQWNFGDNSGSVLQNPGHNYNRPGEFDIELIVADAAGCKDTLFVPKQIKIGGPTGNFLVNPAEGCRPLTSKFYINNANDVAQITWDFGDGFSANGDSAAHTYSKSGTYYPNVILINSNNCSFSYESIDTVMVDTLIADFTPSISEGCVPASFTTLGNSQGRVVNWTWNVDGNIFPGENLPEQLLANPGDYSVKLIVENPRGCLDSVTKSITVHPLPHVSISGDTFFCEDISKQLFATEDSNFTYQWIPSTGLDDPNSASPIAELDASTVFRVVAEDQNGCVDTSAGHAVRVFPEMELRLTPDTTIVMGDTAHLRPVANQPVADIEWLPNDALTCNTCFSPDAVPLEQITYTISVSDTAGCYRKSADIVVNVIDDIKIAMPEIFSPNSDEINDLLFVKGWNIKELLYFRIYNRWGELIFETNDLNVGWDGTYKGADQNMDSYAYVIKALSYTDREAEVRGSFNLIR